MFWRSEYEIWEARTRKTLAKFPWLWALHQEWWRPTAYESDDISWLYKLLLENQNQSLIRGIAAYSKKHNECVVVKKADSNQSWAEAFVIALSFRKPYDFIALDIIDENLIKVIVFHKPRKRFSVQEAFSTDDLWAILPSPN